MEASDQTAADSQREPGDDSGLQTPQPDQPIRSDSEPAQDGANEEPTFHDPERDLQEDPFPDREEQPSRPSDQEVHDQHQAELDEERRVHNARTAGENPDDQVQQDESASESPDGDRA